MINERLQIGYLEVKNRPLVNGTGVLLQGEAAAGGNISLTNVVFTTGTQTITGPKNFTSRPTFNNSDLITTGDLVNLELNILGLENFVRTTGNQTISDIKNFTSRPTVMGSGVLLQGEIVQSLQDPFNGNRPIRRLPVIDTNYGGTTISGFLNNLFFPYANAELSLNNFSVIGAYGYDTISSITFAGSLNTKDDNVTGIACLFSNTILRASSTPVITNNTYSISSVSIPVGFPPVPPSNQNTSTEDFKTRIFGTRNGVQFTQDSNNVRLRFAPPYFYGISSDSNLSVNVTGLTRVNPSTYLLLQGSNYNIGSRPSSINGVQFTFNNSIPNGYIYFAYLDHTNNAELITPWGQLATSAGIVDAVSFADYTSTYTNSTVQINFPTRSNITYRIYRSPLITPVSLPTTFTLNFKFA